MATSAPSSSGGEAEPTHLRPPGSSRCLRDGNLKGKKAGWLWVVAINHVSIARACASLHLIQHADPPRVRDGPRRRTDTDADR